MKKFAWILFALLILVSCSQDKAAQKAEAVCNQMEINQHKAEAYELFPTQNMWTFLKLDTRNGKIYQVQFDVQGDNRMETVLNDQPLVANGEEIYGRFTLYATQNIYNFVLLDKVNGKTWQVQWSIDDDKRGIVPISQVSNQ